jgi:adenine-specific DNA-methyltransferase
MKKTIKQKNISEAIDYSLPQDGAKASISYANKLSEDKILAPIEARYINLKEKKKKLEAIEPNSFVLSDNFLGLNTLYTSGQKAKLIYLDPPYSTGSNFISRDLSQAYEDKVSDARYIETIRRRLILMREILDDEGSIYLHIGEEMLAHLKVVMDEIFGEKNFRNLITRRKCSSKNFTKNQYSNLNDYILFYSKTKNYIWNQPTTEPDDDWKAREYPKLDEKGQYKLVPVHAPGVRKGLTGTTWKGMMPPKGKHWQYQPEKLEALDKAGYIHWSKNGNPRRKVYLDDHKGIAMTDYWDQYRDAFHQSTFITGYPTEKNLEMLKMIISASSNIGDLVIDPYSGSGTTIYAANLLDRKWIGMDQSILSAQTIIKRFKSGMSQMGDYVKKTPQKDLFPEGGGYLKEKDANYKFIVEESYLLEEKEALNKVMKELVS